jgi:hypothetical protein
MVKETVLCIKRSELPGTWLKEQSVVPMSLDLFVNYCSKAGFKFIDRKLAESRPDIKQIRRCCTCSDEITLYNMKLLC